jgi:hypothetical protein
MPVGILKLGQKVSAPSSTDDKLYNIYGNIMWNGQTLIHTNNLSNITSTGTISSGIWSSTIQLANNKITNNGGTKGISIEDTSGKVLINNTSQGDAYSSILTLYGDTNDDEGILFGKTHNTNNPKALYTTFANNTKSVKTQYCYTNDGAQYDFQLSTNNTLSNTTNKYFRIRQLTSTNTNSSGENSDYGFYLGSGAKEHTQSIYGYVNIMPQTQNEHSIWTGTHTDTKNYADYINIDNNHTCYLFMKQGLTNTYSGTEYTNISGWGLGVGKNDTNNNFVIANWKSDNSNLHYGSGNNSWQTPALVINDSNKIGIGTNNPQMKLHIETNDTGYYQMLIKNTGTSGCAGLQLVPKTSGAATNIRVSEAGLMYIQNNKAGMIIQQSDGAHINLSTSGGANNGSIWLRGDSGNVGIGLDNPSVKLEISESDGSAQDYLRLAHTGTNSFLALGYNGGGYLFGLDNEPLRFGTNSTEKMRITSDGKVGIGTVNPLSILHIEATDAIIIPKGTTAEQPTGIEGMLRYNTTDNSFEGYNGTEWGGLGGSSGSSFWSSESSESTNINNIIYNQTDLITTYNSSLLDGRHYVELTDLSISITPNSTNSKIKYDASIYGDFSLDDIIYDHVVYLKRTIDGNITYLKSATGSSAQNKGISQFNHVYSNPASPHPEICNFIYYDEPNTTSIVKYDIIIHTGSQLGDSSFNFTLNSTVDQTATTSEAGMSTVSLTDYTNTGISYKMSENRVNYSLNTDYTDIGELITTITPSTVDSKIKITAHIFGEINTDNVQDMVVSFKRTINNVSTILKSTQGTNQNIGIMSLGRTFWANNPNSTPQTGIVIYYDEPNTTSEVTYTVVLTANTYNNFILNSTVYNVDSSNYETGISSIGVEITKSTFTQIDTLNTYVLNDGGDIDITELTVNITPKSLDSIIIIDSSIFGELNGANYADTGISLKRVINNTATYLRNTTGQTNQNKGIKVLQTTYFSENYDSTPNFGHIKYFDQPNTLNSITYNIVLRKSINGNQTWHLNSTINTSVEYGEFGISFISVDDTMNYLNNNNSITLSDNSKNLGIGTDNPTEKLDVNGTIKATSLKIDAITNSTQKVLDIKSIGSTTVILDASVNESITNTSISLKAGNTGKLTFTTANIATPTLVIDNTGKVGIGVGYTPSEMLDVNGTVKATDFNGNLVDTCTAVTQTAGNNTTKIATTAFVNTAVSNLVDSAPTTLDTLNELAAALGDDPNYATTITAALGDKAPITNPTFSGVLYFTGSRIDLQPAGVNSATIQLHSNGGRYTINAEHTSGDYQVYDNDNSRSLFRYFPASQKTTFNTDFNLSSGFLYKINGVQIDSEDILYVSSGTDTLKTALDSKAPLINPNFTDKIGIGQTNPISKLDLGDSGGDIRIGGNISDNTPNLSIGKQHSATGTFGCALIFGNESNIEDYLAFSTHKSGVSLGERMRISGIGNVGIGQTNPTEKLEVNGTVKATSFIGDGSGLTGISSGSSLWSSNGNKIYYNTDNIGIGTDSPDAKLDVEAGVLGPTAGNTTTAAIFRAGRQNLIFQDTRTATQANSDWNNATFKIIAQIDVTNHQSIDFVNTATFQEHIDIRTGNQVFNTRFTHDGKVGIGIDNPSVKLEISESDASGQDYLRLAHTGTNSFLSLGYNGGGYLFGLDNEPLRFGTNNTERMRISEAGNVGIGVTNPNTILELGLNNTTENTFNHHISWQNTNTTYWDWSCGPYINNNKSKWSIRGGSNNPPNDLNDIITISSSADGDKVGIGVIEPLSKLHIESTDAIIIPKGTTTERPTGNKGMLRFNTTDNSFEGYNGTEWGGIGGWNDMNSNINNIVYNQTDLITTYNSSLLDGAHHIELTDLSTSIKPRSSNSKIKYEASIFGEFSLVGIIYDHVVYLKRTINGNSTYIKSVTGNSANNKGISQFCTAYIAGVASSTPEICNLIYYDEPNTTSIVKYDIIIHTGSLLASSAFNFKLNSTIQQTVSYNEAGMSTVSLTDYTNTGISYKMSENIVDYALNTIEYVEVGELITTITPSSLDSKVKITAHIYGELNGDGNENLLISFKRTVNNVSTILKTTQGLTIEGRGIMSLGRTHWLNEASTTAESGVIIYYDEPNTTNSVTYSVILSANLMNYTFKLNSTILDGQSNRENGISSISAELTKSIFTQIDTTNTYTITDGDIDITELTVNITPKSLDSVIIIDSSIFGELNGANYSDTVISVKRAISNGSTTILKNTTGETIQNKGIKVLQATYSNDNQGTTPEIGYIKYFDKPNTLNAITYSIVLTKGVIGGNQIWYLNRTITLSTQHTEYGMSYISVDDSMNYGNNIILSNSTKNIGIGTINAQSTLHIESTDALIVPKGTTTQQPIGVQGMLRFNTTDNSFEGYNGTEWGGLGGSSGSSGGGSSTPLNFVYKKIDTIFTVSFNNVIPSSSATNPFNEFINPNDTSIGFFASIIPTRTDAIIRIEFNVVGEFGYVHGSFNSMVFIKREVSGQSDYYIRASNPGNGSYGLSQLAGSFQSDANSTLESGCIVWYDEPNTTSSVIYTLCCDVETTQNFKVNATYNPSGTIQPYHEYGMSSVALSEPNAIITSSGGGSGSSGGSSSPNLGEIIQLQHKDYTVQQTRINTGWVPIDNRTDGNGYVVSIIPTNSNSNVFVSCNCHIGINQTGDARWYGLRLYRKIGSGNWEHITGAGGTTTGPGTECWLVHNMGVASESAEGDSMITNLGNSFLDSPNTTETVYYTIYWNSRLGENPGNDLIYLNRAHNQNDNYRSKPISTITAQEIWTLDSPYNGNSTLQPGQIIETLASNCDGSVITVQSGTYTFPNVTAKQDCNNTTFPGDLITGSNISYKPPSGTKRVIYEFYYQVDRGPGGHYNSHLSFYIAGNEIQNARSTVAEYIGLGTLVNFKFIINCDVSSTDYIKGHISNWTDLKELKIFICTYNNAGYATMMHDTTHWAGAYNVNGGLAFRVPNLQITAIA